MFFNPYRLRWIVLGVVLFGLSFALYDGKVFYIFAQAGLLSWACWVIGFRRVGGRMPFDPEEKDGPGFLLFIACLMGLSTVISVVSLFFLAKWGLWLIIGG